MSDETEDQPDHDEPGPPPAMGSVLGLSQRLFDLARAGDLDQLGQYLLAGVQPNLTNDEGDSLLIIASYHGHEPLVRLLLEHGAHPEMPNAKGQTPLAGVTFKGHVSIARVLVEAGARADVGAPSALEMARMFERTELIELFDPEP